MFVTMFCKKKDWYWSASMGVKNCWCKENADRENICNTISTAVWDILTFNFVLYNGSNFAY